MTLLPDFLSQHGNGKLLHIPIISYYVFTGVDVVLYRVEG